MVETRLIRLQAEHDALQREYHAFQRRALYVGVLLLVTAILLSGGALIVANRAAEDAAGEAARQSELKFCAFVVEVRNGYRASPPGTPAGRRQAELMERLAGPSPDGLNCDGK